MTKTLSWNVKLLVNKNTKQFSIVVPKKKMKKLVKDNLFPDLVNVKIKW